MQIIDVIAALQKAISWYESEEKRRTEQMRHIMTSTGVKLTDNTVNSGYFHVGDVSIRISKITELTKRDGE